MKDLVEYIAKSLVTDPEQVEVESYQTSSGFTLALRVSDADKGRVIGRRGRVVNAIETLLRVIGTREGVRINIDIL